VKEDEQELGGVVLGLVGERRGGGKKKQIHSPHLDIPI
jgi:hypothetical protein